MFRNYKMIGIAALAITSMATAARAGSDDTLAARVHDAAMSACAPERVSPGSGPRVHYGAIADACVYRLSRSTMHKYENLAKTGSAAKVANK
jgi:hypothetical protein